MTLAVAIVLATIHIFAGKLRFLDVTPRSIWLSSAGGASVAYVFLHILPDLAEGQHRFSASSGEWLASIERHVWILALIGLAVFYGLERLVRESQTQQDGSEDMPSGARVFWLHIGSFAIYNALFGYLLLQRREGERELLLFGLAIGLHFIVNDFGLRKDHRRAYDHTARWVLAIALIAGWALASAVEIHELGVTALYALLAGGIILNVLKEELPEQRRSRFWAFLAGATGYAALLMVAG